MTPIQYAILLRGINVGGKNIIKMADLKACLDAKEFDNVATYIQSGNLLLESTLTDPNKLELKIKNALLQAFNYRAPIVIRSQTQLSDIVTQAPKNFGHEPTVYRYDVIFLKEPLSASEAIKSIATKEGVDEVAIGPGVLYFSRLISKAAQSRVSRLISLPIYQHMTIRNWNTTTKLLALMGIRAQAANAD